MFKNLRDTVYDSGNMYTIQFYSRYREFPIQKSWIKRNLLCWLDFSSSSRSADEIMTCENFIIQFQRRVSWSNTKSRIAT